MHSESIAKLGKHQRKFLDFLTKYPGAHYVTTDRLTKRVVQSLIDRGLIERVYVNMYRLITK